MSSHYDVIVVGSGLGGLSSATMLARNGLKVLLLERHNVPGGYATSFVRGRYEFEAALHELSGIGTPANRGSLYHYLDYLNVAEKVEFLSIPDTYRSIFPGLDVVLPVGRRAYEDKLCETFPHESTGIRKFLKRIFSLHDEISIIDQKGGIGNPLLGLFRYRNAVRYLPSTLAEVLHRDIADPRARAVISQYWGYFGLPPSQVSFLYFTSGLASYITMGPSYVKGRSQALSNAFVATFEEYGGDVRFNCAVRKISTSNGRVVGVITDQDEYIEAKAIVSNADPLSTYHDLLEADAVPGRFLMSLRQRTISASSMNVFLGIDCPAQELGFDYHENFINSSYDLEEHYQRMWQIGRPGALLATCYNTIYPDISPPGTSMVVLTALNYGRPWAGVAPQDYTDTKNRVAEQMLQMTEQVYPNLRQRAEVVEVATPITNIRYTGASGGAIYGFSNTFFDHTVLRLAQKGPIGNLFFAGAWTSPGGGFEPCIISGRQAAELILSKMNHEVET